MLYFATLPYAILLISVYFLLEETPKFILRNYSPEKAVKAFNWIGKINKIEAERYYSVHELDWRIR